MVASALAISLKSTRVMLVKLKPIQEIAQRIAALRPLWLALRFSGVPEEPENDELGRTYWRNTDLADQATVVDVILRHG